MIHGINFGSFDGGNKLLFLSDIIEGAHYVMALKDGSGVHVNRNSAITNVSTGKWLIGGKAGRMHLN